VNQWVRGQVPGWLQFTAGIGSLEQAPAHRYFPVPA